GFGNLNCVMGQPPCPASSSVWPSAALETSGCQLHISGCQMDHGQLRKTTLFSGKSIRWPDMGSCQSDLRDGPIPFAPRAREVWPSAALETSGCQTPDFRLPKWTMAR